MASESDSERQSLLKADDENHYSIPTSMGDQSRTPYQSSIDERTHFVFYLRGGRMLTFGRTKFNIFLSVITVVTNVMMVVSLPLFSGTVDKYNDEYPVIFFTAVWFPAFFFGLVFLQKYISPNSIRWRAMLGKDWRSHIVNLFVGFLNCINGLLVVYASDPSRTSPSLQALLSTSVIPFTVICRYIFLRKGVSYARLTCTGVVLVGLFISLEPEIFNIQSNDGVDEPESVDAEIPSGVWPFIFVLGFLPLGILNAFIEKQLKKDETESLVFLSWVQFFSGICIGLFFWTDFIPGFGAANDWGEFKHNMAYGAKCMYGQDDTGTCKNAVIAHWVFVISYCFANLMVFVLVRFAEGAIYLVVVQAITTPLGSLFFTFFKPQPFRWEPTFDITVAFRLAGLCIIVPAVVFYNYFGEQERRRARRLAAVN